MNQKCPYCGNNPTPHVPHYIMATSSALFGVRASEWVTLVERLAERITFSISPLIAPISRLARVHSWQNDPAKAISGRARVLWTDATRRGVPMRQLVLFGDPVEFYCALVNGTWVYFDSLPIPPQMHANSYAWMDDKLLLKRLYIQEGIPVARGGGAWSAHQARIIFDTLEKPVIVKPRSGTHGRHSATNIRTHAECDAAFSMASQLCQCVIVEEHLVGSVYRATYVAGEIRGILRGDPLRVTGDGVSSVKILVEKKNAARHERVAEFTIDEKCIEFLARQGLTPESVIENGAIVDMSEKIGLSYGGSSEEMLAQTHPKLLSTLKRAGDLLKAPVVGFDFIIPDATHDPDTQKWGIIEANARPFIDLHHFPLIGTPVNVASAIWDLWNRSE